MVTAFGFAVIILLTAVGMLITSFVMSLVNQSKIKKYQDRIDSLEETVDQLKVWVNRLVKYQRQQKKKEARAESRSEKSESVQKPEVLKKKSESEAGVPEQQTEDDAEESEDLQQQRQKKVKKKKEEKKKKEKKKPEEVPGKRETVGDAIRRVAGRPARESIESRKKTANRSKQSGAEAAAAGETGDSQERSLEEFLGKQVLNKVGGVILVLGIIFFITYTFQYFNKWLKLGSTTGLSLVMIGTGMYLKQQDAYKQFSIPLMGIGWSVLYFTVFSAYAVDAVRIFYMPEMAGLGMITVSAGMVGHALYQDSRELTMASYLYSYGAIAAYMFLLGDYDPEKFQYSSIAVLFLAGSSLYIIFWKQWEFFWPFTTGTAYLMYFLLYPGLKLLGGEDVIGQLSGINTYSVSLVILWGLFQLPEYLLEDRLDYVPHISIFNHVMFGLLNSLFLSNVAPDYLSSFLIGYGALMGAKIVVEKRRGNEFLETFTIPFSAGLVALGLATEYSGYQLSLMLLVEMEVLTVYMVYYRDRYIAKIVGFLLIVLTGNWLSTEYFSPEQVTLLGSSVSAGWYVLWLAAAASYANTLLIEYRELKGEDTVNFPVQFLRAGSILLMGAIWYTVDIEGISLAWGVCGIVGFELGAYLNRLHLKNHAAFFLFPAAVYVYFVDFGSSTLLGISTETVIYLFIFLFHAYLYWRVRTDKSGESRPLLKGGRKLAEVYAGAAVVLLATIVWIEFPRALRTGSWGGILLLIFLLRLYWDRETLQFHTVGMFLATLLDGIMLGFISPEEVPGGLTGQGISMLAASLIIVGLGVLEKQQLRSFQTLFPDREEDKKSRLLFPMLYSFGGTALMSLMLYRVFPGDYLTVAWGIQGLAFLVSGMVFRRAMLRFPGLAVLLVCVVKIAFVDLAQMSLLFRILSFIGLGAILIAASYLYFYFDKLLTEGRSE